jgi:hypothetical protein
MDAAVPAVPDADATRFVGGCGGPLGTTAGDGLEAADVPIAFVATAVKVYVVPFVKPVTVSGLAVPVALRFPGLLVTVNEVMGEPPLLFAVNATEAEALPDVTEVMVGALGTVAILTALDAAEAGPAPWALLAVTVNV